MFWRLGFMPAEFNTPEKFYDDLLPLLLGKPLDVALKENGANVDTNICPLRTNERAALTAYRSVREAWVFFMQRNGIAPKHTMQVPLMSLRPPLIGPGVLQLPKAVA